MWTGLSIGDIQVPGIIWVKLVCWKWIVTGEADMRSHAERGNERKFCGHGNFIQLRQNSSFDLTVPQLTPK